MRAHYLALILILSCFWGCGGQSLSTTDPAVPTPLTHVVGHAQLDEGFRDATITFQTRQGESLSTTVEVVTDPKGFFQADVLGSLTDFRVVATRGGESYASDYEGFDATGTMVVINPLTNLISAHQDAHPELSLGESEQAVRNYLELPANQDVHFHLVTGGHRPGFQVARYLEQARMVGPETFLSRVVASVDQVRAGISPPAIPNALFQDNQGQFWEDQSIQLGVAAISTVLAFSGIPAGALIGWGVDLVLGVTQGSPEQQALQALAEEIAALGAEVDAVYNALSEEIRETSFNNDFNTLVGRISIIETVRNQVNSALGSATPVDFAQQQALTQLLIQQELRDMPNTIHNQQMGGGGSEGLIRQAQDVVNLSQLPFYGNLAQFNLLSSEFNYCAAQATSAVHLIMEGYHAQNDPAPDAARLVYDNHTSNLAAEASALPQPLDSDDVIYHRTSGLIFYRHAMYRTLLADAQNTANCFQEGGYKNWRVATSQDIMALLGQYDGQTFTIDQLQQAGFDFTSNQEQGPSGPTNSVYNMGMGDNVTAPIDQGPGVVAGWAETARQLGLSRWEPYHYCYLLVCDAASQDSSLIVPALSEMQSIQVVQNGSVTAPLQALATYAFNQLENGNVRSNTTSQFDVSALVQWSTSDPGTLRIQNPPATSNGLKLLSTTPPIVFGPGVITWLASGTVTATASAFNPFSPDNDLIQGNITLTNNNVPPPAVQSVIITPRFNILNQAPSSTDIAVDAFYTDGTAGELTSGVTWTTSIPEAQVVSVGGVQYQLNLTAPPPVNSFTITATVNGKSDTVTWAVNIP